MAPPDRRAFFAAPGASSAAALRGINVGALLGLGGQITSESASEQEKAVGSGSATSAASFSMPGASSTSDAQHSGKNKAQAIELQAACIKGRKKLSRVVVPGGSCHLFRMAKAFLLGK